MFRMDKKLGNNIIPLEQIIILLFSIHVSGGFVKNVQQLHKIIQLQVRQLLNLQ